MATETQRPTMPQATMEQQGAMEQYGRREYDMRPTGDETKGSFKTTEFYIYLASVAAVLFASWSVGTTAEHDDYFRADQAWWFISLLTIGYLVSRGLSKAGSPKRSQEAGARR